MGAGGARCIRCQPDSAPPRSQPRGTTLPVRDDWEAWPRATVTYPLRPNERQRRGRRPAAARRSCRAAGDTHVVSSKRQSPSRPTITAFRTNRTSPRQARQRSARRAQQPPASRPTHRPSQKIATDPDDRAGRTKQRYGTAYRWGPEPRPSQRPVLPLQWPSGHQVGRCGAAGPDDLDSDVERLDETAAFLGEQKYDLAGAYSDSANPR